MVVWIVAYLHLLNIDGRATQRLNAQIALCYIWCTLTLDDDFLPDTASQQKPSISRTSINRSAREDSTKVNVIVGFYPEGRGIGSEWIQSKSSIMRTRVIELIFSAFSPSYFAMAAVPFSTVPSKVDIVV